MSEFVRRLLKVMPTRMTAALLVSLLVLVVTSFPTQAADVGSKIADFNVSAVPLPEALSQFGQQSGLQLSYALEIGAGLNSKGVSGHLTVNAALKQLLAGTEITWSYVNDDTVVLKRVEVKKGPAKKGQHQTTFNQVPQDSPAEIQEIVVSAQKRGEESLQSTPIPITVVSAEALAETEQVALRDYYTSVPGLTVAPNIEQQQMLSIRGISTGGGSNPTVGILIDDVPYGSSINWAGNTVPDIDPGDLARIEVLRGPQGTLYGANSLGGLVRYVTKDPSTHELSGRIEVGASDVYNGAEPGFNIRGSVNVPITDTLAVRASAFSRQDPGYIDNVVQHVRGVDETEAFGSRLTTLWKPNDAFSMRLSALYQSIRYNGIPEVDKEVNGYVVDPTGQPPSPPLGDLQQNYVAGIGKFTLTNQAYAAVLKLKLGGIELTSDTGYNLNRGSDVPFDFSGTFGPIFEQLNYGVSGAPLITQIHFQKVSEELRLSGSVGSHLDWLIGDFYTDEKESPGYRQTIYESNATTGQAVGTFYDSTYFPTFKEYAGFADATWHFTDEFDVQIGARESHNDQSFKSITTGPFLQVVDGASPNESLQVALSSASGSSSTYLLTPRLKISPDLMLYARLASGYRPGGPNYVPNTNLPPLYDPDKTYNYELGVKGDFLDHRFSLDGSVYYIDWKNLQLQLQRVYSYDANGSRAKSEGVELSVEGKPLRGLTISGWMDYDNAVLTADFPSASTAYGVSGNRLPNTPEWSANLTLEQQFRLADDVSGFVGAVASYIGARSGLFTGSPERQSYSAYTRTDLRAGVSYESWTTTLYVNNLSDVRGITSGGLGYYNPSAFTVIQPRTVGLTITKALR